LIAPDLSARAAASRRWLLEAAFPLWSTAGFDAASGQFVEQLSLDGAPSVHTPRRTLVQARQLYGFAVAARMGWTGAWRAVMDAAADAMLAGGRTDAGDWIFAFDASGRPLDARRDLYTQAFAIIGLVHAAQALGREDLMAAAVQTRRRLEDAWRAPGGGFVEGEVHAGVRRQNPHMHLFEAITALWDARRDPADAALGAELLALFEQRFAAPGGVLEYFDDGLAPLDDARGRVLEPGHAFEWSWLIGRWTAAGGAARPALAQRLYAAASLGVNAGGFAQDEVWTDGSVKSASARLWPQAERLKAALAHGERTGDLADAGAAHSALASYLDGGRPGLWRDRRLADGGWVDGPSPASSGYHVVGALDELINRFG
jgi:mannose/cellobiose epimerase-like protein (N-acyl-D-glucosamine 2-epimerase family)